MPTNAEDNVQAGGRHLRDYWKVLWQGRYTVLGIFLAVVALAFLRVALATPIYEATAAIEIRPEARRIIPGQEQWVGAEGGGWLGEEKYFSTQLEVLRGRDIAERVFKSLHLEDHPSFAEARDPVGAFVARIDVSPKTNTRLVHLRMRGPDPRELQEWVNALAETYVRRNVQKAVESFTQIMDKVEEGLVDFRANLGEADTKRLETAAGQDLFVPENQEEILGKRLSTYSDRLTGVRIELTTLSSELDRIATADERGEDLLNIPRFYQDSVVQSLFSQRLVVEREIEQLAADMRSSHPEYQAKQGDLRVIGERLQEQFDRILEKLHSEYALAKSNEAYLQEQIRNTEEQAYQLRKATSNYDMETTNTETKRRVYDVVAETMERLTVGAQLVKMNNNVSVLEKAIEPHFPVYPRKRVSIALGGLLGLILGIGVVLFLDYLDNTIRTPEEIEQFLGVNLLGIIPRTPGGDDQAAREAFQSLRTSVIFSSRNRERNVLLLTSAGPQEGKSSTTAMLAQALAFGGDRVLVVDCDLRRPTQHAQLGVGREPGITNYLLEANPQGIEPFTQPADPPSLSVLTSGPIPPNPPDLLGMTRFRDLIREVKRKYDWVLIDSPPVASLADSVMLASMVDMMILVIKHNENDRDLIRTSLNRVREADVHVAGAVLNNVDMGRSPYGYYYYGSDSEEKADRKHRGKSTDQSKHVG